MNPGDGPPDEAWQAYFSTHHPHPEAVRDVVLRLHQAKKHNDVIALVEAALIEGQSQAWMYEVLALSMEVAGRPKPEIERVLMSGVDFTAVNIPNMLYSAAYLTRFGRNARALQLYRQASTIDPTRPEPYLLGMKLARELKDADGVQWAACGILMTVWTKDFELQHREADESAKAMEATLRQQGRNDAADRLAAAIAEAKQRDLVAELTWDGDADLDLIVEEPLGTICSFESPRTAGGGLLVHDGYGTAQSGTVQRKQNLSKKNTYETYLCPRGIPGTYRIKIRHVSGDVVGKRAALKLTRYEGTRREIVETLIVEITVQDKVIRVTLNHGRLKELSAIPPPEPRPIARVARRPTIWQMVAPDSAEARDALQDFLAQAGAGQGQAQAQGQTGAGQGGSQLGAVGYQPVISVLSEGVTLSVAALVSADRRYVRLTLAPVFSAITGVNTFSFFGSPNSQGGGGGGATGSP